MRKHIFTAGAVVLVLIFSGISAFAQEGGYVGSLSVTKGDIEKIYISSSFSVLDISIYHLGTKKALVTTLHEVRGGIQQVPDSAYKLGCGWQPTVNLVIPSDWQPGVYEADFPVSGGTAYAIFAVKEKVLGSYSKTVVCLTVNTYEAYNSWGGKSLYGYNSTDNKASEKVSFDRPFSGAVYFQWTDYLNRWLSKENIPVEYCTNLDLDHDPDFLSHYDVYVTAGHDEYWSRPERNVCQNFVDRGGRMIILSGNTCWWQVRMENDGHTLVCYKDRNRDPLFHLQDSLVTYNWRRYPVLDSENRLTGVSFEQGGYVNSGATMPKSQGYGGYTAYHTEHWIYNGTGTQDGGIIGFNPAVVGYETDGTPFYWSDGIPRVTGRGKTPLNFSILGLSPATTADKLYPGNTTMGYYTNSRGGAVFNAATTNWVSGLITFPDSTIIRMTRNIFLRFRNTASLPPEIISYSPTRIVHDSINNQLVYVGYRTMPMNFSVPDTFVVHAYEPQKRPLFYRWYLGEDIVSQDSFFILSTRDKEILSNAACITVYVSNGTDTVSLDWALLREPIHFVSVPPNKPQRVHSLYEYKLKAYSLEKGPLSYELIRGPHCMHLKNDNCIIGNVDTSSGTYNLTALVTDSRGNTDQQTFEIVADDTLLSPMTTASPLIESSSFPNPFSAATTIEFDLQKDIPVSAEIISLIGIHVKSLLINALMVSGKHSIFWDGTDGAGKSVPNGAYLCKILGDNQQTVFLKLIKY